MKRTLLHEVATLTEGQPLDYITGQITKIEPFISAKAPSANPKESKPFNCQRIHINDGETSVVLKLWDREEMPQTMLLNPLHVWTQPNMICLKAKTESGRDGKKIYIAVSKEAEVSMNAPESAPAMESIPERKPEPKPPTETKAPEAKPEPKESFESESVVPPKPKQKSAPKNPQPGPRVGMAMNLACANLTARNLPLEPIAVMEITSDLLRVAQWFEDGNLVPTFTERKQKQQQH